MKNILIAGIAVLLAQAPAQAKGFERVASSRSVEIQGLDRTSRPRADWILEAQLNTPPGVPELAVAQSAGAAPVLIVINAEVPAVVSTASSCAFLTRTPSCNAIYSPRGIYPHIYPNRPNYSVRSISTTQPSPATDSTNSRTPSRSSSVSSTLESSESFTNLETVIMIEVLIIFAM